MCTNCSLAPTAESWLCSVPAKNKEKNIHVEKGGGEALLLRAAL